MEKGLSEKGKTKKIAVIVAVILLLFIILLFFLLSKKTYQVTFNSNGGTEVSSVEVKDGDKIKMPNDPVKEGYIFEGWYYLDKLYDFDTPVKQDMTLDAKWIQKELPEGAVAGVKLNVESISLGINGADTLVATIEPEDAVNQKVIWESSDTSIVTVDENGNIKGLKAGKATITVTTEDGGFKAECTVTVTEEKAEDVKVTGVKISGANSVTVGSTINLKATVSPSNATNKKVTWKSSNTSIATVDSNGNVKGIRAGKVTITATTEDGNKTASVTITVKAKSTSTQKPTSVAVTSVTITGARDLTVGDRLELKATVNPNNATNKKVTWKSNNTSVATVDGNGRVTAVNEGVAVITVTTADGNKTASVTIKVTKKVEKLTYSLEWVEVEGSSVDQTTLYIKASNGKYVSGKVELTLLTDKKITIDVTASGNSTYPKKIVKDAVIKSVG